MAELDSISRTSGRSKADWLTSNRKWLVPVGCVGVLLVCAVFVAGVLAIVFGAMRSSWAYSEGTQLAMSDPQVIAALGEPISVGWFISGEINVAGTAGYADLAIPLRGSRANGTLHVVAERQAGKWLLRVAKVRVDGRSENIDLLNADREDADVNQVASCFVFTRVNTLRPAEV